MVTPDPLRPIFERHVPGLDARALAARVAETLSMEKTGLPFRRTERHFLVWIPDGERRLWSPWLHLDVEESVEAPDGSDASRLFGRFTPAPSLWTAVMLGCLALVTTTFGALFFAYSQWLIGMSPWGLWVALASGSGLAVLVTASRLGQARARHQMARLVEAVDRCA